MYKSPDTIFTKDSPLQVVSQGIHSAHPCCLVILWLKIPLLYHPETSAILSARLACLSPAR